jgi:4-hydroxybenzoate polyprenyltransferase/phosphoserine phosphatase
LTDDTPLVVDLDGTLIRSNLLVETGFAYLRGAPWRVFNLLRWLIRGKAALKHELARATDLDVARLPYCEEVVALIESERRLGRRIVLATASNQVPAEKVARHLMLFDEVIASTEDCNLSAGVKRDALIRAFGERGYDYVGDSAADLEVWRSARRVYVANAPRSVSRRAEELGEVVTVAPSRMPAVRQLIKALRPHQWLKNILLFVPLVTAHRLSETRLIIEAVWAFVCFGLCASSVYVLNDMVDVQEDRRHPGKRLRPFAAGRLSIAAGARLSSALLVAAFGIALWRLPLDFLAGLAIYYALTLAYSLVFKGMTVIDVVTLAVLYTLRIIVGAVTLDIPLSFWLLAFSMFFFLSLAFVKRFAELFFLRAQGTAENAPGRGYRAADLEMIASLGASSGYIAVMVLALYVNDSRTTQLYRRPELIWFACPLLLTWVSRVWMLAHRGQMNDDPVIFAVTDRISLAIGCLVLLTFWAAT